MRIENVFRQLEDLAKKNNRKRLLRRGIALLSAVVLLFTVNTLKRNAVAMQPKPTCGYDYDHSHTEACFDENGMAICGLHEHTDDCFQNPDEEAAPEELEVELGDVTEDGAEDLAPEAIDADAAEAPAEEIADAAPADYTFDLNGQSAALVSDILARAQLPVAMADVQMVGLVDDAEVSEADDPQTKVDPLAKVAPLAVALVDGDISVTAMTAFDAAEIAIVTENDIYTVRLLNGAPQSEVTDIAVETEIPEDSEVTDIADEAEISEDSEVTDGADEAEIPEDSEVTDGAVEVEVTDVTEDTEPADEALDAAEAEESAEVEEPADEADDQAETAEVTENAEQGENAEVTESADETENNENVEVTEPAAEAENNENGEVTEPADETENAEDGEVTEPADEAEETENDEVTDETAVAEDAIDETLYPAQSFEQRTASVLVNVTAEAGAFPADTTMSVKRVWDRDTLDGIADAVTEDFVEVKRVMAVDITFYNAEGEEIEPLRPVSVVMTVNEIEDNQDAVVVHMDDEGNAALVEQSEAPEAADARLALNVELPAGGSAPQADETIIEEETADETTEDAADKAGEEAADEAGDEASEETADEAVEVQPGDEAADEAVDEVDDGEALEVEPAEAVPAEAAPAEDVAFEADAFSVYAVVVTETIELKYIAQDGKTFDISVGYGPEAAIPAGATLRVEELTGEAGDAYLERTEDLLDEGERITLARYFDITILDAEGQEVQPAAPVRVVARLADDPDVDVQAVHFADEGEAQLIAARRDDEAVAFSADSFSVYGIVYTVDFYYDVDGKTFEYHINGGDVLSLRALLPILRVVEDDPETEADEVLEFAGNIRDVRFSDETLVRVVPVAAPVTAGEIVDALGEEIEYSARLTEDDIDAIRARAFTAPDWALVSLKPFTSHESLTITLKDGEVVTVKVEDAQSSGYFTVDNYGNGYLRISSVSPYNDMQYVYAGNLNSPIGTATIGYNVSAYGRADYIFNRWQVRYSNQNSWEGKDSSTYKTNVIAKGSFAMSKLWGNNGVMSEIFTACFIQAQRGFDIDPSCNWGMGKIKIGNTEYTSAQWRNGSAGDWKDSNGKNAVAFEAVPNSGYAFDHWNYYRSNQNDASGYTCTTTFSDRVIPAGTFDMDRNESWFLKAVFKEAEACITVNDWNMGSLRYNNVNYTRDITAGNPIETENGKNKQGIVAVPKPGYDFSHWTVTNKYNYTWDSGLYKTSTIEDHTFDMAALTDRKETFTAIFKPVNQFSVKVAEGYENMGTYGGKYVGTDSSGNGITADQGAVCTGYGKLANEDKTGETFFKYGFSTTANDGYEFAFWMYRDQETELYKGLNAIKSGDIVPYNGVTYEAYFTEQGKKLIVYQSGNSAMGSVSESSSYGSETGATATVYNDDDYIFTGWYDQNGHCVSTDRTFDPSLVNKSAVLTAEFAERRSGNVTFKVADGSQGTLRIADSETTSEKTVHMNESGDGMLEKKVVAVPNDGNSFIYWELNRNGNILRLSYDSATIDGDSWLTFQNGDTMTAYFSDGTWRDFNASQTAQSDIEISDAKKRELQQWLDSLKNSHTASADKTAHVYDYDNRIYQIDITAESSLMDLEADIDLAFIIDVSNSMLFPSKLVKNGDEMILTQDNLNATYSDGSTHYIISDPTGTSTAYRIFRKADGIWYYVDASLTDDVAHKVTWDCRYSETDRNAPYKYPIYDAVGDRRRVDYLNDSLHSAIGSLHSIMNRVESAGGTTHDIRVAHSTFAASVYSITPEKPFVFEQFQSMKNNENLTISVKDTGGGTRQDLALRDARGFQWDGSHKKYAILITDGAPVVGSKGSIDGKSLETIRNDIGTEADNLKNQDVTLITVGLSTQNVLFGSNKLKDIASTGEDGKSLFFQAEHADDLEGILLDILRMIMRQKTVSGEVTDVIDPAFYPVDQNGNPVAEGMYLNNGTRIGDNEHVGEPRYEWRKDGNSWKITYHNQIFGTDETWKQSVLVKAKENFLGGNTIPTNVSASVQPMWYSDDNGQSWRGYTEDAIDLPVPHVNVDELSLTENSTAWTVYLGTNVNPLDELKRLYTQIDVNEVVSRTVSGQHVTMTASDDMIYPFVKSDTDGRDAKTGANTETFKLSTVALLTNDDWTALIGGNAVEKTYSAYTHDNVGKIVYELTKEVVTGESGLETIPHETAVEGQNVEKYTLTATYVPTEEVTPTNGWHTTPDRSRGDETDEMQSANQHVIHVFVKGLMLKKMNATLDTALSGAEFRLYRTAREDESASADLMVINGGRYVPVSEAKAVDNNGIVDMGYIERLPEGEQYYLVETKAPDGYTPAAPMLLKLEIEENKTYKPSQGDYCPYDWTQTARLSLGDPARRSNENWNDIDDLNSDSVTYTVRYRIPNNAGVSLPATGGMGTGAYTLAGAGLVLAALALLIARRRRDA